ncbi:MAG: hypothetical protein IKU52_05055 [Clostridia bacterium]|nr:hypothetical protein [Clostridia bacterium]
MYIDFKIENQKMRRCDNNTLAANSQNIIKARFVFDESWDSLNKRAVFEYNGTAYSVGLTRSECTVPFEVLKEGEFSVGVIASGNDGSNYFRATSNVVLIEVEQGPSLSSVNASEPTPLEIERIEEIAQSVRRDADNGVFSSNISIGEVESVSSEKTAEITNTGTSKNPVLNFKIPRGKDGSSLYSFSSVDEIKNLVCTSVGVSQNMELYFIWTGENTDVTILGGTAYTFLRGAYYTALCGRWGLSDISFKSIQKTGYVAQEVWELISHDVLDSSKTEFSVSLSNSKKYNSLSVLLTVPPVAQGGGIELWTDSVCIGKVNNALSSEKTSYILIDAYRKYMWNTAFNILHTNDENAAENIPVGIGEYQIKNFYNGGFSEDVGNIIKIVTSGELPSATTVKIMGRRA